MTPHTQTCARLAITPGIGEPWPSADPRLAGLRVGRIEGFENHLIFYRNDRPGIEIVRVLHGSRDIEGVFQWMADDEY